jgi:hypothetical protein
MLPALINFREINDQQAQKFQEVLLGAGYDVPNLMLQASCQASIFLMWCSIMQRHKAQPLKQSAKHILAC